MVALCLVWSQSGKKIYFECPRYCVYSRKLIVLKNDKGRLVDRAEYSIKSHIVTLFLQGSSLTQAFACAVMVSQSYEAVIPEAETTTNNEIIFHIFIDLHLLLERNGSELWINCWVSRAFILKLKEILRFHFNTNEKLVLYCKT